MIRISIDTETGGFDPEQHSCLSIGYVVVSGINLTTVEKGEILIKGDKSRCTKEALEVNKIDLKQHNKIALTRNQAVEQFEGVLARSFEDKIFLIGQNPEFDIKFLKHIYFLAGKDFKCSHRVIDLVKIWWGLEALGIVTTTSASLDVILDYLKLPEIGQRHSALVDAENVVRVLRFLKRKFPKIPML